MTESTWLASRDPAAMMAEFGVRPCDENFWCWPNRCPVHGYHPRNDGRREFYVSKRQLRLFVAAAVDLEMHFGFSAGARWREWVTGEETGNETKLNSFTQRCQSPYADAAQCCAVDEDGLEPWQEQLPDLIRDIAGNPFRAGNYKPGVKPSWVSPDAEGIAELLYERKIDDAFAAAHVAALRRKRQCCAVSRNKGQCACLALASAVGGRLPEDSLFVLADALEEAGCQDELVLRHLRGYEPCPCLGDSQCKRGCRGGWLPGSASHFVGCWALEVVLGKWRGAAPPLDPSWIPTS